MGSDIHLEDYLPLHLIRIASILGYEYAWRKEEVQAVVSAARDAGLATLGGQAQFRLPQATCEMNSISYDASPRKAEETWEEYVHRSAKEVLERFRAVSSQTDFYKEAQCWELIRDEIRENSIDPLSCLWFVLYFSLDRPS